MLVWRRENRADNINDWFVFTERAEYDKVYPTGLHKTDKKVRAGAGGARAWESGGRAACQWPPIACPGGVDGGGGTCTALLPPT